MSLVEQTQTLVVTGAAAEVVRNLLEQKNVPDYGLRVFVSGGGCSGMQYGMSLDAEAGPFDHVLEVQGIRLYVDPTSMMYLEGSVIDYEDSLMGGGFRINNPNAASTCGCGHSFKTSSHSGGSAAPAGGGCGSC